MFVADFGYATCEYTNGTLTAETLSVEQVEFILKSLKVFPNPVTNGNSISIKAPVNIEADVKLYNLTGKLVFENNVENINSKSISLSNLPNGVYMLQITINNTAITQKIVIMK
jgi:LEA14-like dessication related protein